MFHKLKQTLRPYVGLLRLYSLVDLWIMLYAVGASSKSMVGAMLMWIGFLALLEAKHSHAYRPLIPRWWALVPGLPGFALFPQWADALGFLVFSYIYSCKNEPEIGPYSNVLRAVQTYFLVHGATGNQKLAMLALALTIARNFIGDLRDLEKDQTEGMNTLPIVLGMTKNYPPEYHLLGVACTSALWWTLTSLNPLWLAGTLAVEYKSYDLTPRGGIQNANTQVRILSQI